MSMKTDLRRKPGRHRRVHIAYEALQRALAKDPSKRKDVDGFTPEQRFFISFAQIWRTNIREAEAQRLVTWIRIRPDVPSLRPAS